MPIPDAFTPGDSGHGAGKGYSTMLDGLRAYFRTTKRQYDDDVPSRTRKTLGGMRRRRLAESKLTPAQRALIARAKRNQMTERKLMDSLQGLKLVSLRATWVYDLSDEECTQIISKVRWKKGSLCLQ